RSGRRGRGSVNSSSSDRSSSDDNRDEDYLQDDVTSVASPRSQFSGASGMTNETTPTKDLFDNNKPSSRSVTPRVLSASSRSHTPGPQGQFSRKQSNINSFTKMAEGGDEPTSRSVTPRFRSSSVTELPNSRSVTPKAGITTDLPSSRSATPVLRTSP
ncbi:unnamed protein product, partial [Sphagnum compactum]